MSHKLAGSILSRAVVGHDQRDPGKAKVEGETFCCKAGDPAVPRVDPDFRYPLLTPFAAPASVPLLPHGALATGMLLCLPLTARRPRLHSKQGHVG